MTIDPIFHDLIIDACKQPECPICRMERSTEEDYLDDLLRKYLKEPEVNKDLRGSLGLCHEHSWQLLNSKYSDALAFSLIYHGILLAAINNLQSDDRPLRSRRRLPSLLERFNRKPLRESKNTILTLTSHKSCPACEQRDRTAWLAMEILGVSLENEVMSIALESSDGLCLPHLRLAYAVMRIRGLIKSCMLSVSRS